MENTQKYDKQATAQYIKDSNFHIFGFMEHWFCNGKLVFELKHDAIPQGMTPGYSPNNMFTVDNDMVTYRGKKKHRLVKGDQVMREIIAICGRLKSN